VDLKIQLITFAGCPNAAAARAVIERALSEAGIAARIEEIDTSAADAPPALREWGSPTILVNGIDVAGGTEPTGPSCRLYRDPMGGARAAPPDELLMSALKRAIYRE
jgi:mercuric ion transport protein